MSVIYRSEAGADRIMRRYREVLDAWPVPGEHVRVPTREGETFAVVSGPEDAPPLVLLHGSGTNAAMWTPDVASWARHFRTYAVDVIGEPGLSAPSRPPLASDALALWLDDVLAGLDVTRASVVGASLGGWLALDYAARRPEKVARLAVLCPGGVGRQKTGWLFRALLLRPFGRRGARWSTERVTGLDRPRDKAVLDDLMLTFEHFLPRTERLPVFSDETLRGLAMPVLVVAGERDAMFDSSDTARRVRACVPRGTVRLLPGVGHAVLGQTGTVLEFLRDGAEGACDE